MSHAVKIDFEGMSIACTSICDQALSQLCKINNMLEWIDVNASSLINDKINDYKRFLLQTKSELEKQIEILKDTAKEVATKKTLNLDSDSSEYRQYSQRGNIVTEANNLRSLVQDLTTTKLLLIEDMIQDEIENNAIRSQERLRNQSKGIIEITQEQMKQLALIEDITLRECVYQELIKFENHGINMEQLVERAKQSLQDRTEQVTRKNIERIKNEIKDELIAAKIPSDKIANILTKQDSSAVETIKMIREQASQEIIDESIRKETIKIIIKTIEKRNFIVDKRNIKLNRDKNEVTVVAQKASGEKAEFKIYLDGKFIYKFDGYEGQACQKDIEPFMSDLEDIYGIKVTNREEIWRNPDKISTMKYQTMNENKGKN